jgi:hypothetical protein
MAHQGYSYDWCAVNTMASLLVSMLKGIFSTEKVNLSGGGFVPTKYNILWLNSSHFFTYIKLIITMQAARACPQARLARPAK